MSGENETPEDVTIKYKATAVHIDPKEGIDHVI